MSHLSQPSQKKTKKIESYENTQMSEQEYRAKMELYVNKMISLRTSEFEKRLNTEYGKDMLRRETDRQKSSRLAREKALSKLSKAEKKVARIREKFIHFDMDQSGYLDEQEFSMMIDSLCIPMTPEQKKDAFNQIDTDSNGGVSFDEFHMWYKSDGKTAMKRMRLARLRMKSLKRMNSMLGFSDEERARRVLLATVISSAKDKAKADYVKSNPPPLDTSNEKYLQGMGLYIPPFTPSSKKNDESDVVATTITTNEDEVEFGEEELGDEELGDEELGDEKEEEEEEEEDEELKLEEVLLIQEINELSGEVIPMMMKPSVRRVSVQSLEYEKTLPTITSNDNFISSSELRLEDDDTPVSVACIAQMPSKLNVSCRTKEDVHDVVIPQLKKSLPVDPWKFAMLKDIIRGELKAGRDVSEAISKAREANLAPRSIRGQIYTDWDGLRDVMRTFTNFRRTQKVFGIQDEAFDTLILLAAETASDWRQNLGGTNSTVEAGARIASVCALTCGTSAKQALAVSVAVLISSIRKHPGEYDTEEKIVNSIISIGVTNRDDAVTIVRDCGGVVVASPSSSPLNRNLKPPGLRIVDTPKEKKILEEEEGEDNVLAILQDELGLTLSESKYVLKKLPELLSQNDFRSTVKNTISLLESRKTAASIVTKMPSILLCCHDRSAKLGEDDDVTMPLPEMKVMNSPTWYLQEIIGLTIDDMKIVAKNAPEILQLPVKTLISRIERLLEVGWPPLLLVSLFRNRPRSLLDGWEEDVTEEEEEERGEKEEVAGCDDDDDQEKNEERTSATQYVVENVLGEQHVFVENIKKKKTSKKKSPSKVLTPSLVEESDHPSEASFRTSRESKHEKIEQSFSGTTSSVTLPPHHQSSFVPSREQYLKNKAQERARKVQDILWNIFHFYCSMPNGYSVPGQLKNAHFLQLLTDCNIVKESPRRKAVSYQKHQDQAQVVLLPQLSVTEVDLAWTKSLVYAKRKNAMSFKGFCNALTIIGLTMCVKEGKGRTPQHVVADVIRSAILPRARRFKESVRLDSVRTHPAMLSIWLLFGGPDRSIYVRRIFSHYRKHPWKTRRTTKGSSVSNDEEVGFGWDEYQRFLKDFGLTRQLPQRVAKRVYVDIMSRETHIDDTSPGKHRYRPPCLTFPQFRDLLIRIGYRMIEIERSSKTVSELDLACGFYRVFLSMYEQLVRFAHQEENGHILSIASWPHIEMIRSASLSFSQNFQRVTRQVQMSAYPKNNAEAWINRVMRRHLDLSTTVSNLTSRRRSRIEGGVFFE